jgi:hypothetical protein
VCEPLFSTRPRRKKQEWLLLGFCVLVFLVIGVDKNISRKEILITTISYIRSYSCWAVSAASRMQSMPSVNGTWYPNGLPVIYFIPPVLHKKNDSRLTRKKNADPKQDARRFQRLFINHFIFPGGPFFPDQTLIHETQPSSSTPVAAIGYLYQTMEFHGEQFATGCNGRGSASFSGSNR